MNTTVKVAVAGRKTMGRPLLERLQYEGFPVACSFNTEGLWVHEERQPVSMIGLSSVRDYASVLDKYMRGVEVIFLAISSGPHELPLIEYCLDRGIYVILFCKHALASEYARLAPRRHMIGANATVGGRTMSLPWLRMQHLQGKQFILYAYWNASTNHFQHGAADGGSPEGMFDEAKMLHLAEPGSKDYVGFLNAEIGGDYRYKIPIAINDSMLEGGPYMTPDHFEEYVPLEEQDVQFRTLPTHNDRYLIRIDNIGLQPEFERGKPGSLYAAHRGLTVSGGFVDISRNNSITRWMKGGKANGVQIRFVKANSYEGSVEMAGLGAGPATVGAAMNDLYEFIRARDQKLLEASWPERRCA